MTTVLFDKTGTLSTGRPEVVQMVLFVSEAVCSSRLLMAIIGVAESSSEHPLGAAIVSFARKVWYTLSFLFLYASDLRQYKKAFFLKLSYSKVRAFFTHLGRGGHL